jgi:probable phosphoglycerate mutase
VTPTTIYLVRHGRTSLNAQGRFRGRQDLPLDDRGFVEASEAASRLAGAGVRAVYTGPLLRSLQTAEVIAWASGVELFVEQGLIDLDHGVWTGLTWEEAGRAEPEALSRFREEPRHAAAPGGESMPEVESRTLVALTWIAEHHGGEAAAAVSHEVPIRLVIAGLAEIQGPAFWDVQLPTGSVTTLNFEDGAFSLAGDTPTEAVP